MPEVEGKNLREVFWNTPLRQLMGSLRSVCEAVGYAHSLGVVHRDLKPSNIMIGPFGQVFVLDWGLAKVLSESSDLGSQFTRAGFVLGTPAYMSPEQATGDDTLGPRSDVFALGCVLYEMLVGRVPYDAADPKEALRLMLQQGRDPLPRTIPAPLRALCDQALELEPEARPPSAEAVASQLADWLENSRRSELARKHVSEAQEQRLVALELRRQAHATRQEAQQLLEQLHPADPVPEKRPAWRALERAEALERQADRHDLGWQQSVAAALHCDPDLKEAHALLATHHRAALEEAEGRRDPVEAARAEARLRSHDRGEHAGWLEGTAQLSVDTELEGSTIRIYRYESEDRRLIPRPIRTTTAPIRDLRMPPGGYLLELERGPLQVRIPVHLGRCEALDLGRVWIPNDLEPNDVWITPGPFASGGDDRALDSLPRRTLWCDGFVIRRFPVTNAEYLAFLDDLVASQRSAEAFARCPRTQHGDLLYGFSHGRFSLEPEPDGELGQPTAPVIWISWEDAMAYCRWRRERDRLPWRLPVALEWEKAARGVDGRCFPWGDHLDASWCAIRDHFRERPRIQPIDSCPEDTSPYGVRGLAGNVRDLCGDLSLDPLLQRGQVMIPGLEERPRAVTAKGGSWLDVAPSVRAASRARTQAHHVSAECGFRLARSAQPPRRAARRESPGKKP